MSRCDLVLDQIDAAVAGTLPAELARHLEECPDCRRAVERARGLAEGERLMGSVRAPEALKERLRTLRRLPQPCEDAIELLCAALDGELSEDGRTRLLEHLHGCPACQAVWEAFATLHEVGANARPAARLRADLALSPRQRLETRRRPRRLFDLRLATAAAYLLAALTVVLLSNPETVARESTYQMDRAATYASAAVQNRVQSYSERAVAAVVSAEGWVRDRAGEVWRRARSLFGGGTANRKAANDVVRDGGRS